MCVCEWLSQVWPEMSSFRPKILQVCVCVCVCVSMSVVCVSVSVCVCVVCVWCVLVCVS